MWLVAIWEPVSPLVPAWLMQLGCWSVNNMCIVNVSTLSSSETGRYAVLLHNTYPPPPTARATCFVGRELFLLTRAVNYWNCCFERVNSIKQFWYYIRYTVRSCKLLPASVHDSYTKQIAPFYYFFACCDAASDSMGDTPIYNPLPVSIGRMVCVVHFAGMNGRVSLGESCQRVVTSLNDGISPYAECS